MKYATMNVSQIDGLDGALAMWLAWYKSRGTTDAMVLLFSDQPPRPPTEDECMRIVRYARVKGIRR